MLVRSLAMLALTSALITPALADPPTFVPNVEGTGQPGIDGGTLFIWNNPPSFTPDTSLRVDRHVGSGSGQSFNTYKTIWGLGSTNPDNAGFEWVITGELHNNALASKGAQNVAVNGTAFKESNGIGPVGPTWAGNFNCVDNTGEANPTASCIGIEVDVSAGTASTDNNRQRVGIQVSGGGAPGNHVGYGILMSPTQGSTIDRGISIQGSYQTPIDLTTATPSGATILMSANQYLGFDGNPSGGFGHFLFYDAAQQRLNYYTPGGPLFSVADDGALRTGRVIQAIPHTPASSGSPCETGEQAYGTGFFYQCVGTNHWQRAALGDF